MTEVEEASQAASAFTGNVYGLAHVCHLWGVLKPPFIGGIDLLSG